MKDLERADKIAPALSEGRDDGSGVGVGQKALVLCKSRAFRVVRRALQALVVVALLLVLANCFAPPGQSAFDVDLDYSQYWKWPYATNEAASDQGRFSVIGASGPLRMVVFGMPDVASSPRGNDSTRLSWTEALCKELGCSSHESFVPDMDLPNQAVVSKEAYQLALDDIVKQRDGKEASGLDYGFIKDQFPLHEGSDLVSQVDAFLARPAPSDPPKETIWVFSFGTWDVWTLANLPREQAKTVNEKMIDVIFEQIDRLYEASSDPKSAAYSDFGFRADKSATEELQTNTKRPGEADAETEAKEKTEAFRVVVAEMVDVSLAPGWDAMRPRPPPPHRSVDQMTTASFLSKNWNTQMGYKMRAWMDKDIPKEEDEETEIEANGDGTDARSSSSSTGPRAPSPRRLGLLSNATRFALDVMVESDMRQQGLTDAHGWGVADKGDELRFQETRRPCTWEGAREPPDGAPLKCERPDEHLFYAPFTLGDRAVEGVVARTARFVAGDLFGVRMEEGKKKGWFG